VKQRTNYVQKEDSEDEMYTLHQIRDSKIDPYETTKQIIGKTVLMEINIGASLSIINENVHKSVKKRNTCKLKPARLKVEMVHRRNNSFRQNYRECHALSQTPL